MTLNERSMDVSKLKQFLVCTTVLVRLKQIVFEVAPTNREHNLVSHTQSVVKKKCLNMYSVENEVMVNFKPGD